MLPSWNLLPKRGLLHIHICTSCSLVISIHSYSLYINSFTLTLHRYAFVYTNVFVAYSVSVCMGVKDRSIKGFIVGWMN